MSRPPADVLIVGTLIALAVLGLIATLLQPPRPKPLDVPVLPPHAGQEAHDNAAQLTERAAARAALEAVTSENDRNARSVALSRRLRGAAGFGGLLLVLTGCAARTAPEAFPGPLAPLPEAIAAPAFEEAPDACPVGGPLLPGELALPFVGADGIASCRAQVVTEGRALELVHAEAEAQFWQGQAAHQWRYRALDRAHCEEIAGRRWQDMEAARTEARAQRWITLGGVTAALFIGAALGLAAGSI